MDEELFEEYQSLKNMLIDKLEGGELDSPTLRRTVDYIFDSGWFGGKAYANRHRESNIASTNL
jgi:hypothetical protein